jgi:NADH-quinone oxidoreductase subunit J
MTPDRIIFILAAAEIIGSAIMVVTTRRLIHAALWLVAALFGVAILYALLQAGFLVVVQVVVYIGAIAILFIFAVMLTRREMRDRGPQLNKEWWLPALLAVCTFGGLAFLFTQWEGFSRVATVIPKGTDTLGMLSTALISPEAYMLPFEVASVLLLAALIGAVYVAVKK